MSGIRFDWGEEEKCLPSRLWASARAGKQNGGGRLRCSLNNFHFHEPQVDIFEALWPHLPSIQYPSSFSFLFFNLFIYFLVTYPPTEMCTCTSEAPLLSIWAAKLNYLFPFSCWRWLKRTAAFLVGKGWKKNAWVISIRQADLQKIHNSKFLYLKISSSRWFCTGIHTPFEPLCLCYMEDICMCNAVERTWPLHMK